MAATAFSPVLKASTGRNIRGLLRLIILCTIAAAAVSSRLFSVIRMSTSDTLNIKDQLTNLSYLRIRKHHP